jgi:hypothetical protein
VCVCVCACACVCVCVWVGWCVGVCGVWPKGVRWTKWVCVGAVSVSSGSRPCTGRGSRRGLLCWGGTGVGAGVGVGVCASLALFALWQGCPWLPLACGCAVLSYSMFWCAGEPQSATPTRCCCAPLAPPWRRRHSRPVPSEIGSRGQRLWRSACLRRPLRGAAPRVTT